MSRSWLGTTWKLWYKFLCCGTCWWDCQRCGQTERGLLYKNGSLVTTHTFTDVDLCEKAYFPNQVFMPWFCSVMYFNTKNAISLCYFFRLGILFSPSFCLVIRHGNGGLALASGCKRKFCIMQDLFFCSASKEGCKWWVVKKRNREDGTGT